MDDCLVKEDLQRVKINKLRPETEKAGKFRTQYGYFSDDGREYIITRPDTPKPWVNVVCNGDYGFVLSQTGSGFSWRGNSNLFRLTRWHQDLVTDEWGKYIYIRDNDSKDFWSLSWKPVCVDYDFYECRHGTGYTIISSLYEGIESSMTVFVPQKDPVEIWKVVVKNTSSINRRLSLFSYLEWQLGSWDEAHREFNKLFIDTEYKESSNAIFSKRVKRGGPEHKDGDSKKKVCDMAFHAVNIRPDSFEGDKQAFLGNYGNLSNPFAVQRGSLSNTVGRGYDPIASLQVNVDLNPGEEKTIVFILGENVNGKKRNVLIKKYSNLLEADKALRETRIFWDNLLDRLKVETPDEAFNFMTNVWLKYQAISGRLWGRTAYYQTSGAFGFRDQLQDSQVFLPLEPVYTRRQILLHAEHQFFDGTVYHWWHPITEYGVITGMTDDLLWLAYVTLNYIEETGDYSILKEKVKYLDGPPEALHKHCTRAIDKVLSRFSKRGLPLIGEGDWNDGMNRVGVRWKGESIWLGHFLYGILQRWVQLAGEEKILRRKVNTYRRRAQMLKTAINRYGWDGEWYIRATKDNGSPLGSSKCKEGKIFLNAQTWAVINETAQEERAKLAIEKVEEILIREYGPLLFYPAYTVPDESIGYLSCYPPGVRENGGIYSHAGCWAIMAECILGKGETAYKIYSKMCPVNRGMDPQLYCVEPYVMPGNVDGPDSIHFGRGGWTWYTGSAAWMFRISTEWILGVRPGSKGLIIDPCIPKEWDGFRIERTFRGATYLIEVENPEHVEKGVKEILLDGKSILPSGIPFYKSRKVHRVKVIMGKSENS